MALDSGIFASAVLFALLPTIFAEPGAYQLNFSSNVYGPDGPWHAVRVALGTPPQEVDLYPATWYSTWPLTSSVCDDYDQSKCQAKQGGFYNPGSSSTFKKNPPSYTGTQNSDFASNYWNGFGDVLPTDGSLVVCNETLHFLPDSTKLSVPESGVEYVEHANFRAAGGATYPITLGYLTLGAGNQHTRFSYGGHDIFNVAYSWLYDQNIIPSPSWTLHMGSPSLGIEPSMYLGGYDENRIMGNVLPQLIVPNENYFNNLAVRINDIALGTARGPSPFPKGDQANLLSAGGAPTNQVNIEPAVPYLFLPKQTCINIAEHLPVTYHTDYGVYLWDTKSPDFEEIMASSSYLSFSLSGANDPAGPTIEIKIPFQLLNLTLTPPITTSAIQYFPCSPVNDFGEVALGRAFLQAAFIGVNWYFKRPRSWWFVAQAPGPKMKSPSVRTIAPLAHGLFSSSLDWEGSWSDYWDSVAKPSRKSEPGGLSTGAQAGIGVGVALGVLLIIGLIMFFWWRRRRHQESKRPFSPGYSSATGTFVAEPHSFTTSHQSMHSPPFGKSDSPLPVQPKSELEQPKTVHELPGYNMERYELSH